MRDANNSQYQYDVAILSAHYPIGRMQWGAGYRYLELAWELQDLGVRVAIVAPVPSDFDECPVEVLDRRSMSYQDIHAVAPVFVFCLIEDEGLVEHLRADGKKLIYDSFLSAVEFLTLRGVVNTGDKGEIEARFREGVQRHNAFNGYADYFIVGERAEKLLKFGELINTYRVGLANHETLGNRVFPLPVLGYSRHSLPEQDLSPAGNTMLWNGGLWGHYSGNDLIIDAVVALHKEGFDVSFHFLYPDERWQSHARILHRIRAENLSYVRLGLPGGRLPDFFEKQPIIAGCRALVILYEPVLQMQLFPSMRLREMLLYEKPVIVSKDGAQGDLVAEHGVGLTVENTVESVRDAMERLMTDQTLYRTLVENIRRLKTRYDFRHYVPAIAGAIMSASAH
jgi:glycosyltransferase involved in cell wall biosynthesis